MKVATPSPHSMALCFLLSVAAMLSGCGEAAPRDVEHSNRETKKVQATTIYVHDPLLSISEAQRDHYAKTDFFLNSGRLLANFIRNKYPSKTVNIVHWPLNSAAEILSNNPEDYRTGEELRNGAILIKVIGSTGSKPWVGRPTKGYAKLLVTGDPEVLGATSLLLDEPEVGDAVCSDLRCSDPEQLIASIRGRVVRVIEGT